MTLTINDTTITSDQTPHVARQASGPQRGWEVSWLPSQILDRNTAITCATQPRPAAARQPEPPGRQPDREAAD